MHSLISKINVLKKSEIQNVVSSKLSVFSSFKKKSNNTLFKELSFCVLTANFNAKKSIFIQNKINNGFITYSLEKLASSLKKLGHRFPNARANYIVYNRQFIPFLKNTINFLEGEALREWFIKNIKGFSYKEASHFLRNIGFFEYSIIDFHIIDILHKHKLLDSKPKTFSKKNYLAIEHILLKLSKKLNMSLGELDLYLWFLETNSVYK